MALDAIKVFCDVASTRSFSKAASTNAVTQSAISQRVMALEESLGVQLIDRSTRPLHLTEAGEIYFRGCREVLERYEALCDQIRSQSPPLRGEVVLASIYSAGIDLLNQVRAEFMSNHPRSDVRITYLKPREVHDAIIEEQVDFGLLSYPDRWRDLAAMPLRMETMVIVVRPDHPLSGYEKISATELGNWSLVGFDTSLPIARRQSAYLRMNGVEPRYLGRFDNIDTIKNFVVESEVAAILPRRTVQREVRQGILVALRLEPLLQRPLAIVHARHRSLSGLSRRFVDYLIAHQTQAETEAKPVAAMA